VALDPLVGPPAVEGLLALGEGEGQARPQQIRDSEPHGRHAGSVTPWTRTTPWTELTGLVCRDPRRQLDLSRHLGPRLGQNLAVQVQGFQHAVDDGADDVRLALANPH
jgi:hypothetical protein